MSFNNIYHNLFYSSTYLCKCTVVGLDKVVLLMATSMASKIAISTTLSILMTCTTEIVSLEKRRLCAYTSTIWTRVWLLTSPFVGATSIFGKLGNNIFNDNLCLVGCESNIFFLSHILPFTHTQHTTVPQTFLAFLNILGASFTALIDTPRTIPRANETNKEDKYKESAPYPELWLATNKQ